MKSIGKATEFVSKAVGALRRKAGVLRARLLFLASPRRRAAVLAGISRHIRALTTPRQPCQEKEKSAAQRHHYCRGSRPLAPADDDDGVVPFCFPHHQLPASLLLVVQAVDGDGGCTADSDWTLALCSLFDDDDEAGGHRGGDDCLAGAMDGLDDDDEASVIDVIRRRREGDGQEFRIDDEIDRAADMYITRVRRRMSAQLEELVATGGGSASH
jgi:hypothetical protein